MLDSISRPCRQITRCLPNSICSTRRFPINETASAGAGRLSLGSLSTCLDHDNRHRSCWVKLTSHPSNKNQRKEKKSAHIPHFYSLNLTIANFVYILEPQWNPMIEDQAIARVLRLGQVTEVKVVRYIMQSTIEEVRRYASNKNPISVAALRPGK